jgi:hypothetical protein
MNYQTWSKVYGIFLLIFISAVALFFAEKFIETKRITMWLAFIIGYLCCHFYNDLKTRWLDERL